MAARGVSNDQQTGTIKKAEKQEQYRVVFDEDEWMEMVDFLVF
jgi:hypothetical protein